MKILVTGCAGFIGFHLAKYLLIRGDDVVGIDNINDYYDVNLKYDRLRELGVNKENIVDNDVVDSGKYINFKFFKIDLADKEALSRNFYNGNYDIVCNLAAQAGVRYSLINPKAYVDSNIIGFFNLIECCKSNNIKHLIYASSSSVYGLTDEMPFATSQNTDHPASLYAASKKTNELIAHCYSHLFGLSTTGLRFFTVYGPWGRPDMALFLFTKAIIEKKIIQVFNMGNMKRDFTYIDDIINAIVKVIDKPITNQIQASSKPGGKFNLPPYQIFNIGRGSPVKLMDFITEIEKNLGIKAKKKFLPMQAGDIAETWASIKEFKENYNYIPSVDIADGVKEFVNWYMSYYITEQVPEPNY